MAQCVIMPAIVKECMKISGHPELVPCRICTAFVSRSQLEGGKLPEETHHDAETLRVFFAGEQKRREDRKDEWKREIKQLRKEATAAGEWYKAAKNRNTKKKPSAATPKKRNAKKRPAAATPKKRNPKKRPAAARAP